MNEKINELIAGMAELAKVLQTGESLEAKMVAQHGEVVNRKGAMTLLNCSRPRLLTLINSGFVETACGGTMISVRSIARYIETKPEADDEIRRERIKKRYGTEFAV